MPALLAARVFRRRAGLPTPCSYCRTSTASQHRHGHSAAEEAPIAVGPHVTTDAGVAISEAMPYFRPYSPITLLCTGLENAKALSGLPWWGVVVGATLAARVLLVPIAVYTMKNGARVAQMKPEMDAVQARLRSEQQSDPEAQARFQRDAKALMERHGANPVKMLLGPIVQAPIFLSFFLSTRRLAEWEPSLMQEGFLWIPSIAGSDPTYILPVLSCGTMLIMAQIGGEAGDEHGEQMKQFRTVMQVAAVGVLPLTYWMPSITFCYWITSNCFSCIQVPMMRLTWVKDAVGIPRVPATTVLSGSQAQHATVTIPGGYAHPGSFSTVSPAPKSGRSRRSTGRNSHRYPKKPLNNRDRSGMS